MATQPMNAVVHHLRRGALFQDPSTIADGPLLESFITRTDEAAFAALVRRHGPMVLGVCHRILRNFHDAEDAFQATFLVLARKASSVQPRERVANWLHGVAYRTALKARTMKARRQARETHTTSMPEPEVTSHDHWPDLQRLLDQELKRLPEAYRLPVVLCDLEGKSIKEATRQLGWPQGTLAGRLARARKMLARRLTQRGVTISGGALAAVLSEQAARAGVPSLLACSTIKAASAFAAGHPAAAGIVSVNVIALMEGVLNGMMLTKIKAASAVLLVLGMLAFGGGLLARNTTVPDKGRTGKQPVKGKQDPATEQASKDKDTHPQPSDRQPDRARALEPSCAVVINEADGQSFFYLLSIGSNRPVVIDGIDAAMASLGHPASKVGEMDIWLDRMGKDGVSRRLTVDWLAITQRGEKQTNYDLHAGDLLVLESKTKHQNEAKLHGEWVGKDNEHGQVSLIFGPGQSIRIISEKGPDLSGTYHVNWAKVPHHLDVRWGKGPPTPAIMEFTKDGKLRIEEAGDVRLNYPAPIISENNYDLPVYSSAGSGEIKATRPKAFTNEAHVLTKKELSPADAAKHLEIAEFYRRTGHFGAAYFYCEVVRRRYPNTEHARHATDLLARLKEHRIRLPDGSEGWETPESQQAPTPPPRSDHTPPGDSGAGDEIFRLRAQVQTLERRLAALEAQAKSGATTERGVVRVGKIIVIGNTETPTAEILNKMQLYPGQVFDDNLLRAAEKRLATLKAEVTTIKSDHGPGFEDVLVTVKE
jgi:RNA polymerase sigma factor (sigma-70 family)